MDNSACNFIFSVDTHVSSSACVVLGGGREGTCKAVVTSRPRERRLFSEIEIKVPPKSAY